MKFINAEHEVIFNKLISNLQNVDSLKLQQTSSSDLNTHLSEIHKNLNTMLKTRENLAHRYISSHRKLVGSVIVFVKKVIRKLLKWYIDPIAFQQTEFNNAVTPAIGRTTELLTGLLNKTNEIEKLSQENFGNNPIQAQYDLLTSQMKVIEQKQAQYDLLVKQIQVMENLMKEKMDNLEQMQNIYADRIDSTATRLERLDEIDIFKEEAAFNIFNKHTFSQSGEDSILAYIIHVLGIPFDLVDYVDLGANHAKEMSNTYFFYSRGAKGVLVEANPELIPELKFYRHRDIVLNNCVDIETGTEVDFYILSGDGLSTPDIDSAMEFCKINPLLKIVDKKSVRTISYQTIVEDYLGKAPTILSIDVEGKDLEILQSVDYEKYRPLLIVTEMISYDITLSYNTKNNEIRNYLMNMEYEEYAFTGINSIFLDKRFLKERKEI